jgi:hypothetical protein
MGYVGLDYANSRSNGDACRRLGCGGSCLPRWDHEFWVRVALSSVEAFSRFHKLVTKMT